MPRALAALLALAALAIVLAGCGGAAAPGGGGSSGGSGGSGVSAGGSTSTAIYTAKGTVPCLRGKGFKDVTTAAAKLGLIASTAANGGLKATARSGNAVTIAFTQSASGVPRTERAFRRFATGVYKRHIRDVMRSQGNAVLVWTTTPSAADLNDTFACLRS